jgi:hypothetical protein
LFQLLAYGLHVTGGPAALVLAKATLVAAAALLFVYSAGVVAGPRWLALATLLTCGATLAGLHLLLMRPVVVTLLFLGLTLLLLERALRDRTTRPLLLLLLVQVLWSNTQPLFPLGWAVVAAFLVGEALALAARRYGMEGLAPPTWERSPKLLAMLLPALVLVSLLTPYGIEGLLLPFKLLGRIGPEGVNPFSLGVSENVPPWVLEQRGDAAIAPFKWIAALAFGSFFMVRGRASLRHLLLLIGFFGLALMANRNVLLFYWVAALVMTLNLARGLTLMARADQRSRANLMLQGALVPIVLLGVFIWAVAAFWARPSLALPAPFKTPAGAAARLDALPAHSPVFCSVRFGGYLSWALDARVRPYIDGRLVLRSPELFARYLAVLDDPARFDTLQAEHGFVATVLPAAQPERYLGLIAHLARAPDWVLTYTDGSEVLFERAETSARPALDLGSRVEVDRIVAAIDHSHAPTRARALLHLGRLLALLGYLDRAEELLVISEEPAAQRLLARVYLAHGKAAAAEALATRLLADEPRDVESLLVLAHLALARGERAQAVVLSRQVLEVEPRHAEARALLEQLAHQEAR